MSHFRSSLCVGTVDSSSKPFECRTLFFHRPHDPDSSQRGCRPLSIPITHLISSRGSILQNVTGMPYSHLPCQVKLRGKDYHLGR